MHPTLLRAPAPHAKFLRLVLERTAADARLLGVAVAGSLAEGTADEESDVDLLIVATDEAYAALSADRAPFLAQFGEVLASFGGDHIGEPRLTIALYGPELLHVDFKFVTLAMIREGRVDNPAVLWERGSLLTETLAAQPGSYPPVDAQWIEDRVWVWVHYIAVKVRRRESLEAVGAFAWFRDAALFPMARAAKGLPNRGARFFERLVPEWSPVIERAMPGSTEPAEMKRALLSYIEAYRTFRAAYSGALRTHDEAEAAVVRYVESL